ncbi:hypothetical protein BS650_19165 [Aeromonas hydrophila]|nr:hypothetical protein BS650_19165 [Aeromonas hydrophila]
MSARGLQPSTAFTAKPPQPITSTTGAAALKRMRSLRPRSGRFRVGCKRSALPDNRGSFDDKGRQNRKICATAGARGL